MNINNLSSPPLGTVFRFRPYSPISLKEILYGEVFFVTKDELNDPYDTKNPAIFNANMEAYSGLVNYILDDDRYGLSFLAKERNNISIDSIASFLAKEDLAYDELIKQLNSKEFEDVVIKAFCIGESIGWSLVFIRSLKHFIHKWTGGHCYIASFSKKCTDPVMWSHYAHNHTGFCLLFSVENNLFKKKESIHHSLDDEYKFEEVDYDKQNVTTNGFYTLPSSIYGNSIIDPDAERLKYQKIKRQSFLTKFESWRYEKEVRLIHDDWFTSKASANGVNKRPICERIFYYDQKQLTGLIFISYSSVFSTVS